MGGGKHFSALKVPRRCRLVLLEVPLREGKALGSEKDNGFGSGLCYEQRRDIEQGHYRQ
jgi:hypothetical protein